MLLIIAAILAAIGVVALFLAAWLGVPVLAIAIVLVVVHFAAARKAAGPHAGTVESTTPEPTGTPRKATGGAETANERVGQA